MSLCVEDLGVCSPEQTAGPDRERYWGEYIVYTERAETAAVSRGTSRVTTKQRLSTPLR